MTSPYQQRVKEFTIEKFITLLILISDETHNFSPVPGEFFNKLLPAHYA